MVTNYLAGSDSRAHSIAWDIAQDPQGVLYFGSTALLSFDGERWTTSTLPDAFAIRRLHYGPDGRIWVAATTNFGWYERDSRHQWQFHSLRDKLPDDYGALSELWGVSGDRAGATFVTQDSILRWNGNHFTVWKKTAPWRLSGIHADGRFFVHVPNDGIYAVNTSGLHVTIPHQALPPDSTALWMEQRENGWLVATGQGLFIIDDQGSRPFASEISAFVDEHRLTDVARLPDGRLVLATQRSGIALFSLSGALDRVIDVTTGLPSNYAISLLVGRDGELWVTTGSGIVRVDPDSPSTIFDLKAGLPQGTYRRITKTGHRIIVAGDPTVYGFDATNETFAPLTEITGRWPKILGTPDALLLAGSREARIWRSGDLERLHETRHDVFFTLESRLRPGEVLVSDNRSILALAGGTERLVVSNLSDNATSLVEDAQGRLWMGTLSSGVLMADPKPLTPVAAEPLPRSAALPKLQGQTYVRGSVDGAIIVLADNGAWAKPADRETFTAVLNYPIRPLAGIADTAADGSVWVTHAGTSSSASSVGRISLGETPARWEPHSVDALSQIGAPRSIFADVSPNGETLLWIGGTQAVLRHRVGPTLSAPQPRAPILRAFATTEEGEREPVTAALPYATRSVEFEFATPEYARRPQLRIESRIDGIDATWVREEGESNRTLTAMRDGTYTIRARVVAETGKIGEERVFTFKVLRPWWRTPLASAGFAGAFALSAAGAYRWRVRRLRQRNAVLEEKVRERTQELERANAAKTEFVANMSHDIRNPLNGIVGLALALENTRLDPRQQEMVSTLRECTTYLSSLVDDVLDFASIEAGKVELRPRAFAPHELLRSIATTMKGEAVASGAELVIEPDPALPYSVIGDAGRIQQIVVNFVSNALKYAGGSVRLVVTQPDRAANEIEFAVVDSGPGLTAEEQATLFSKFARLERDRAQNIPGTGLGLAACRLLADLMGGSVGVTSTPGSGSRFFLRLPLITATELSLPETPLPPATVLLVEDMDYNAWAATAVLAKLGLSCERASTGEEALRLFREKRFNVVLLDRNLPDMDGLDVARRMREHEAGESPAILLGVTAYCTAEDRALCLEAGMDAFVGKPITPEKLRRVLIAAGRRLLTSATADLDHQPQTQTDVDFTVLNYLSDGSVDGLQDQVVRFLASLEGEYADATRAHLADDANHLATLAHRLHGQAKLVGHSALLDAAKNLQTIARSGTRSQRQEGLASVRKEIDALTAIMRSVQPVLTAT